jgi:hypothetical protein
MTAQQIIEEIKRLDPKEQLGVIRFAYNWTLSVNSAVRSCRTWLRA